jgi:regulator of protease activity HflC (stomatin/prohibitin superfamily)
MRDSDVGSRVGTSSGSTPEALLGQLAHELSVLVRADVELAAAEQLHTLRRLIVDAAVLVVAAVSALLALGGFTCAAVRGVEGAAHWWAPLVVACGWLLVAVGLLALEHPRRLVRAARRERHEEIVEAQRRQRAEAERQIRETAEQLIGTAVRHAAARQLEEARKLAREQVERVEDEAGDLLSELVDAFSAPGRAGLSLLDRLVGSARPRR